jgi:hypothetical protein
MTLRITALNDNTAGMGNYLAEWGLSLLVASCKIYRHPFPPGGTGKSGRPFPDEQGAG